MSVNLRVHVNFFKLFYFPLQIIIILFLYFFPVNFYFLYLYIYISRNICTTMRMLSNPIGKATPETNPAPTATSSSPSPTTPPVTKKGCCGGLTDDDKLGMIADDKRKCRDIFCCTLFRYVSCWGLRYRYKWIYTKSILFSDYGRLIFPFFFFWFFLFSPFSTAYSGWG